MNALDILKGWPGWAKAGAEAVMASPAWRMPVRLGEEAGIMTRVEGALADTINLAITLDDEPHVLSLADSPCYPDLHALWAKRAGLPQEVLLALLEKECGGVFELLEKITRRLLGVKGFADEPAAEARSFRVVAGGREFVLALDLSPEIRALFGSLEFLDTDHACIRALTRPAYVDYCSLMLTEEERAALAPGDQLVLPDDFTSTQHWIAAPPDDDAIHVCTPESVDISFDAFADEKLPAIPEPTAVVLRVRDRIVHTATLAHVGLARTVCLTAT